MKQNKKVMQLLIKVGAIKDNDHFVYTSGKHARSYINKDALYPHTKYVSSVAKIIAQKYATKKIDIVVGPSIGGIIISQWTAHHLSRLKKKDIIGIYTEKAPDKNQILTRGYDSYVKGRNVLVVEDIVTTGETVKKVINSIQNAGGTVVGACSIVNKDPIHIDPKFIGVPYDFLTIVDTSVYDEKDCPLCKENIPINTVLGHGKKYLEEKKKLK